MLNSKYIGHTLKMSEMNSVNQPKENSANRKTFFSRAKSLLLISSLLGLGSLNIATLLSDELHASGYNLLRSVLGTALADSTLEKLLSHSSSIKRKRDVAIATAALIDEKSALTSRNKTLTDKHIELETSHHEVSKQHAELKTRNAKQALVAANVSKKIAARSAKAAARNLTSLAGEAVPILGTTLVVGITAWDIYDLCETMKDMNQINSALGIPLEDKQVVCGMKMPTKDQVMSDMKTNWQSAYRVAAASINQVGNEMVAPTPPSISWNEMKSSICPVIGSISPLCR